MGMNISQVSFFDPRLTLQSFAASLVITSNTGWLSFLSLVASLTRRSDYSRRKW